MALFRYMAVDEKGKTIRGLIDADSAQEAQQKLIRRQILVTSVTELKKKHITHRPAEILGLTRELNRLLRAGLPLYESLIILEEKHRSQKTHELLLDLCDRVRCGQSYSKVLEHHPDCFDSLYCAMVSNAERSGRLTETLEELTCLLEKRLYIKKALFSALIYPTLLGSFCMIVLSVLLFFVVPSLFELFEGRQLHPFTAFVFACSRLALRAKWILLSLIGLGTWAAGWAFSSHRGKVWMRRASSRLPFAQDLLSKLALARFFRSAAALIEGGLSALPALQQGLTVLRHPPLERALSAALERLSQGDSLQKALQDRPFVPPLVPRMLGIAEEGGDLASMMRQIASIYEEDLEKAFARIATLAQPVLLLILGAMIGFVLLSVLLPLTDVNTFTT